MAMTVRLVLGRRGELCACHVALLRRGPPSLLVGRGTRKGGAQCYCFWSSRGRVKANRRGVCSGIAQHMSRSVLGAFASHGASWLQISTCSLFSLKSRIDSRSASGKEARSIAAALALPYRTCLPALCSRPIISAHGPVIQSNLWASPNHHHLYAPTRSPWMLAT